MVEGLALVEVSSSDICCRMEIKFRCWQLVDQVENLKI